MYRLNGERYFYCGALGQEFSGVWRSNQTTYVNNIKWSYDRLDLNDFYGSNVNSIHNCLLTTNTRLVRFTLILSLFNFSLINVKDYVLSLEIAFICVDWTTLIVCLDL